METVVVEIAFSYRAEYRMPRKRNTETAFFRSSVPLAFAAISDADAPVVCHVSSAARAAPEETHDYEIRHHDGRFWRPVHEDRSVAPVLLDRLRLLASAPSDGSAQWHCNPFLNIVDSDLSCDRALYRLPTVERIGVREVRSSGRDVAAAKLAASVDLFRLIDGVLYEQCFEPKLVMRILHGRLDFEVVTNERCGDGWVVEVFRPDRVPQARRFAAWLVKDQGLKRSGSVQPMPRISVPRPDLLLRSDAVEMVRQHLEKQLDNARKIVAHLPDQDVASFLRMRRAAAVLRSPAATDADAQVFLEATAEIARASDILYQSDEDGRPWMALREFCDDSQVLLARWRISEGGPVRVELEASEDEALVHIGATP